MFLLFVFYSLSLIVALQLIKTMYKLNKNLIHPELISACPSKVVCLRVVYY